MVLQMNEAEAKDEPTALVSAAQSAEAVIIAHEGVPVARLIPVAAPTFQFGVLSGLADQSTIPDFLEPMDKDELADWERD